MTSTSCATEAALRFVGRPTLEAISRNPVETELFDGRRRGAPRRARPARRPDRGRSGDRQHDRQARRRVRRRPARHHDPRVDGASRDRSGDAHRDVEQRRHGGQHRDPRRPAASTSSARPAVSSPAPTRGPDGWRSPTTSSRRLSRVEARPPARPTRPANDLAGRRILVTAGGTREPLDPVRFIGNRSSGTSGRRDRPDGRARAGPTSCSSPHTSTSTTPSGLDVRHVGTALELQEATLLAAGTADVVIMAAAVADYRPDHVADRKIKKDEQGDVLELRLVRNPDILHELASNRSDGQLVIGFAAETEPDREALLALGPREGRTQGRRLSRRQPGGLERGLRHGR